MKREIEQTAKWEEPKELILQDNLGRKEEHGREDPWVLEEEDGRRNYPTVKTVSVTVLSDYPGPLGEAGIIPILKMTEAGKAL